MFGNRLSYLLLRPWTMARLTYLHVKWFIQRGRRGYADCDLWSIDMYLAKWLPTAIRSLKRSIGFPSGLLAESCGLTASEASDEAYKQWQGILEDIALGFEAARKLQAYDFEPGSELTALLVSMDKGLALFSKYFLALWS